jgi:hypothetical protein
MNLKNKETTKSGITLQNDVFSEDCLVTEVMDWSL